MKKVNVGIDLGTTYSAVAIFDNAAGMVKVLKNGEGKETTPSVVCIDGNRITIGNEAKEEQSNGNVNTAAFYKSMMGNPDFQAFLDGEEYSAEDLSGRFLKVLKKDIEEANDVEITGAVITVPAYFNEAQRLATLRAGKYAGLNVLKIINEPTSAIIAYGLTGGKDKNVLVYDLGGGTFDVTIAKVRGTAIDVISTNGNHQLGGKDWDQNIIDIVVEKFYDDHGIYITDHPEDYKELQVKCEDAKKKLSTVNTVSVSMTCDGITGKYDVTKEEFESRTEALLQETVLLIENCFREISNDTGRPFGWNDLDEVVLVGGSTRMPQVKDMIMREYGRPPVTKNINVDTIVASGAAMQAELCVHQTISLAVAAPSGGASSGAAAQPFRLQISNSEIQDITSHALGMLAFAPNSDKDFVNSIIIKKNSKINQRFSKEYKFAGQELEVFVLQGESNDPYETDILGKYVVTGMPKCTRKDPNIINVDFLYNSNGVVEVYAKTDKGLELNVKKEEVNETIAEIIKRILEKRNTKTVAGDVEIMLFIDVSGSMSGSPIQKARKAAKDFVRQFDLSFVKISICSFSDRSHFHIEKSQNLKSLERAIDEVDVDCFNVGYCNDECPITTNHHRFSRDCTKICIVLTDGMWSYQSREVATAKKLKADGVIIYGIGFGGADERFLDQISTDKGKKVDLSKLSETFAEVADSIASEVGGGDGFSLS